MNHIIKFVSLVAGIIIVSVTIDKIIDKVYDGVEDDDEDSINVEDKSIDINVSSSTCKTAIKAVVGATALVVVNKHVAKKAYMD